MKQEIDQLGYIHFDHLRWTNEIIFMLKEIDIYQNRLLELIKQFDDERVIEELSEIHKEFETSKNGAVQIQLEIKKHIIENLQLRNWNGDLKTMIDTVHLPTKNKLNAFRQKQTDLKNRFQRFSTLQNGSV